MAEQDSHFSIDVMSEIEKKSEKDLYQHTINVQEFTGDEDGSDDAVILQHVERYLDKDDNWCPIKVITDEHPEGKEKDEEIFIPVCMIDDVIEALKVMKARF